MNPDTITRLNQLNRSFYQQISTSFDQTRQRPWEGWLKLVPHLQNLITGDQPLTCLDLGCGNGRFGLFLDEQLKHSENLRYFGADSNQELLTIAILNLSEVGVNAQSGIIDLVASLIDESLPQRLTQLLNRQQPNLIVLFGVTHHVPSLALRQKLFTTLINLLAPNGYLIASHWQFLASDKLSERLIQPEKLGFTASELEPHDYFLDWQRDQLAYRYCHYIDHEEAQRLVPASAQVVETFTADGAQHQLNLYQVIQAPHT